MSKLEHQMAIQIRAEDLPAPEREYQWAPDRKWRFDFAWPGDRLALEVEGGTWNQGRHTRGAGFARDCEKYNTATLAGWRVLRVTGDHVREGQARNWLIEALTPWRGEHQNEID